MNPCQGPALKCAPGQDSIKDSSIIKSYWHGRGVMPFQNRHIWFLYSLDSTPTAMNAENEFPRNPFSAFNWSPILQVSRIGYMPEIEVSRSPGNEFLGNSFSAFRAVAIERRKRIPNESVFDRARKMFIFFFDEIWPCQPAKQPASQPASKPASKNTQASSSKYPRADFKVRWRNLGVARPGG